MSIRHSRMNVVLLGSLALALAVGLPALRAQDTPANAGAKAKVQELAKLSPEARRAELKKMTREERRAVWFELKRERTGGQKALKKGEGAAIYRNTPKARVAGAVKPKVEPPAKLVGSIVYDDGTGSTTFGGGAIIGNRFDTAVGDPLLTSGTISTVVGVVAQGPAFSSSSAGFVIEGPQTGGGGAMAIFSTFTGIVTGTTDTVTFSGLGVNYPGSSFYVLFGDFASIYVPVFDSGTTQSQGHHGVVGYTGGMGPNITSTFDFGNALNALVRVTGNVLPVELMSFDVEN